MACYDCLYQKVCSREYKITKAQKIISSELPKTEKSANIGTALKKLIGDFCVMYHKADSKELRKPMTDSEPVFGDTYARIF